MTKVGSHRNLAALSSLGLLLPLLYPLVTGKVFVFDDLAWFHLPLRHLYQQALQHGDTVLWTPAIFSGLYLHGEGQAGLFHPFHQLLYRLVPLAPAFNLELIASYPAAFAGMFWFLRRLAMSQSASLFGAMLFAFGGFNLLHHHHVNMVAVVAHLPWLLGAADVLLIDERRGARTLAFAAVAIVVGSQLLLGFPQGVWWTLIALAAFAAFRAATTSAALTQLVSCAAAVALGVAIGAIQWLPTADAAMLSTRAAVPQDFALTFSLHPANLVQLWSPYFFGHRAYSSIDHMFLHEFGIYSGAIAPVALAWVWMRRQALVERRSLIAAATAFALVALVLALGRYGGLAHVLSYLPVVQTLRVPARYILLAQFAFAILAALTFDDIRAIVEEKRTGPARRFVLWIPAALCVATTLALNARLLPHEWTAVALPGTAAVGLALVVAVTLAVHLASRGVRWALPVLLVVTAADLGWWGHWYIYREAPRTIQDLMAALPPAPAEIPASYAAAAEGGRYRSNLPILGGYRLTSGYVALFPATVHALESDFALQLSGTRWRLTPGGSRHPFDGAVARLRFLDESGGGAGGQGRLVSDRPGHLVAHVDAPGRRLLAFTERFHHGWSATVDGVAAQTVRIEGDFLGCLVEPGVHRVELRFMPRSFVAGALLTGAGVIVLAGVLIARSAGGPWRTIVPARFRGR